MVAVPAPDGDANSTGLPNASRPCRWSLNARLAATPADALSPTADDPAVAVVTAITGVLPPVLVTGAVAVTALTPPLVPMPNGPGIAYSPALLRALIAFALALASAFDDAPHA